MAPACLASSDETEKQDLVRLDSVRSDLAGYTLLANRSDWAAKPGCLPVGYRPAQVETASLELGSDWWATDLRETLGRFRFRAFHRGDYRGEIVLAARGEDLVLPALMAFAVGDRLGLTAALMVDRLADGPAIPRRFELTGSYRGATLVDDDARGPEGVAGALALARLTFGDRPIQAIFQPISTTNAEAEGPSRLPEPADFRYADRVILVACPDSSWESTRLLAAGLRSSGASVVLCASMSGAIRELDRTLGPSDVVLTLGADAVGTIADAFLRRLARDRHSG